MRDERPVSEVGTSPVAIWDAQEVDRKKGSEGALGACMVVSMELPEGDNRSVRQAFVEVRVLVFLSKSCDVFLYIGISGDFCYL